jgi:hypothetical protein
MVTRDASQSQGSNRSSLSPRNKAFAYRAVRAALGHLDRIRSLIA